MHVYVKCVVGKIMATANLAKDKPPERQFVECRISLFAGLQSFFPGKTTCKML